MQTIATELKPEKIILFGSHARGEATPDSDYDLFVIVPYEGDRTELGARARGSVRSAGVPIDVIVYPKRQLEQFLCGFRLITSFILADKLRSARNPYSFQRPLGRVNS